MNAENTSHRPHGFTLLEIMVAVAIVGILAVAGMFAYQKYVSRAQGSEIAVKYDAIRTNVRTNIAEGTADDCAAVARKFDTRNLPEQYATLSYGFEAVSGGFRPVLSVCATAGKHGEVGVKATRAAHDDLAKNGVVEKGAVVSDSVVSFALRLTANEAAICKSYTAPTGGDCGGSNVPGVKPPALQPPTNVPPPLQPPVQVPPQVPVLPPPLPDNSAKPPANAVIPPQQRPPIQVPPVQTPPGQPAVLPKPPAQNPPVQTPPVQTPPGKSAVVPKPPTQTPSQGAAGANASGSLRLPNGNVDLALLAELIAAMPAIRALDVDDRAAVVGVATQMIASSSYAQAVRAAQQAAPSGRPALVPTTLNSPTTIRFFDDMNRALNAAFLEAQRLVAAPAQTPVVPKPPTQNPSGSLIGPNGNVDLASLSELIAALPAIRALDVDDRAAVVGVATQMVASVGYASAVRAAQQAAQAGKPALVPTAPNSLTTMRFYDDMNRALNAAYLEALRSVCRARGGTNAACG